MTIDTTIDYDALLAEAQKENRLMNETLAQIASDEYSLSLCGAVITDVRYVALNAQRTRAVNRYTRWILENLIKRGIELHSEQHTGKPVGLSITVAGQR